MSAAAARAALAWLAQELEQTVLEAAHERAEKWRQDVCGAWMRREHFGRVPAEKHARPPRNRALAA